MIVSRSQTFSSFTLGREEKNKRVWLRETKLMMQCWVKMGRGGLPQSPLRMIRPCIVSKQGRKRSPGSTITFNRAK